MTPDRINAHRASIERDVETLGRVWPELADEGAAVAAALAAWPSDLADVVAAMHALKAAADEANDAIPKSIADRLLEKLAAFRAEAGA